MKKLFFFTALILIIFSIITPVVAQSRIEWIKPPTIGEAPSETLGDETPAGETPNGETTSEPSSEERKEIFDESQLFLPGEKPSLRFSEMLNADGTTIAKFVVSKRVTDKKASNLSSYAFENPKTFVLKVEGIDTKQSFYLSSGSLTCEEIARKLGGVQNLTPAAEKLAEKSPYRKETDSGIIRGIARGLGRLVGWSVKELFWFSTQAVVDLGTGLYEGLALDPQETLGDIQIRKIVKEFAGVEVKEADISFNEDNDFKTNFPYPHHPAKEALESTITFTIAKINGKKVEELKGTTMTFYGCQKTEDNKLREAKVEIQFGKAKIPEAKTECKSVQQCLPEIGQIFAEKLFD